VSTWCGKCRKLISHTRYVPSNPPDIDQWCECKEPDYNWMQEELYRLEKESVIPDRECDRCRSKSVSKGSGFCIACGYTNKVEDNNSKEE
jgi:hypothetical protein